MAKKSKSKSKWYLVSIVSSGMKTKRLVRARSEKRAEDKATKDMSISAGTLVKSTLAVEVRKKSKVFEVDHVYISPFPPTGGL